MGEHADESSALLALFLRSPDVVIDNEESSPPQTITARIIASWPFGRFPREYNNARSPGRSEHLRAAARAPVRSLMFLNGHVEKRAAAIAITIRNPA